MNPFPVIGHDIKVAAVDVAHAIEKVGGVASAVVHVIEDAKKLTPAFKQELATLIQDAEPLAATLAPVILAKGANIALDVSAVEPVLADIEKLVSDFVSFLPTLKAAVAALEADVTQ